MTRRKVDLAEREGVVIVLPTGDEVRVTLVRIGTEFDTPGHPGIKLGFEADAAVPIWREEVARRIRANERER